MSREEASDAETASLLVELEEALPWPLYQRVREAILWRDEQIRVLKRVIQKLI
jgi:hypothetical protein